MTTNILESYLAETSFKRRKFGGVDEIDALGHLETLASYYEQALANMNQQYSVLYKAYTDGQQQLMASQRRCEELSAQANQAQAAQAMAGDSMQDILSRIDRLEWTVFQQEPV